MYRQFKWLKDCGFFSDFAWDASIPEFARINVIYGPNGTGKTSLAKALDDVRIAQDSPGYTRVSAVVDKGTRVATDGADNEIFARTFVFSEAFVQRSHNFSSGAADMPAVLTVGERTADAERKLKTLRTDLESKIKDKELHEKNAADARKRIENAYRTISKQVVDAASKAGGRWQSRGSYSSGTVKKAYAGSHGEWSELSEVDLKTKLTIINSSNAEKIEEYRICVSPNDTLTSRLSNALATTPTTLVLRSLEEHPEASAWVSQGRILHDGLNDCIFCGTELPVYRLSDIDAHFSEAVTKLERELKSINDEIDTLLAAIDTAVSNLPAKGLFFEDLRHQHETADKAANAELKDLRDWATSLKARVEEKCSNVLLPSSSEIALAPAVNATEILKLRKEHNTRVAEHSEQVRDAAIAVELHYLKSSEASIEEDQDIADEEAEKAKSLEHSEHGIKSVNDRITKLESVEGDPLPSAKVLTEEVSRLLGRSELVFSTFGDRYSVLRDGVVAEGLSLGERTAITLVHFLEMVRCFEPKTGKPIVVIDDPVSSLDSDIFMGVSTYIWNEVIVKDHIEQLFLLTHNFELFRQWDIQIDALHRSGKINGQKATDVYPTQFYEIRPKVITKSGVAKRRPLIELWPPSESVRKKVRSSYHHGFMAVAAQYIALSEEDSTMDARLSAQLLFPNVIRRMLETFLAFKHPEWVGDFNGAMRNSARLLENAGYIGDANALRLRLTRYAHAYSHGDTPITDTVVAPDEILNAMSSVFEFMHCLDPDHFNGLCKSTGFDPAKLLSTSIQLRGQE